MIHDMCHILQLHVVGQIHSIPTICFKIVKLADKKKKKENFSSVFKLQGWLCEKLKKKEQKKDGRVDLGFRVECLVLLSIIVVTGIIRVKTNLFVVFLKCSQVFTGF